MSNLLTTRFAFPRVHAQDLFDRVQRKLEQNKKTPARNKAEVEYLLTTKLFCGHCGAYMCGKSGKSRNGTVHHYYKCVSVKKKRTNCKKKLLLYFSINLPGGVAVGNSKETKKNRITICVLGMIALLTH